MFTSWHYIGPPVCISPESQFADYIAGAAPDPCFRLSLVNSNTAYSLTYFAILESTATTFRGSAVKQNSSNRIFQSPLRPPPLHTQNATKEDFHHRYNGISWWYNS